MENYTIVSAEWLHEHIENEDILIFDASIPKATSNKASGTGVKILGAQFFDIKTKFSDTSSEFPNTIPSEKQFEEEVQKLGVNSNSIIVVYDDKGIYSSARAWWLFKTFGHHKVVVLNGGLPNWQKKNYPVQPKVVEVNKDKGNFKTSFNVKRLVTFKAIPELIENNETLLIDARSSERFSCSVPEPRAGLRSGAVPTAINIPYTQVLREGFLKTPELLQQELSILLNSHKTVVIYCGSGVTACVLVLALETLSLTNTCIYDGSWTEYGTLTK